MKLTAKVIPIDLRRRRALAKAASAAFSGTDAALEPQRLNGPESHRSSRPVTKLKSPMRIVDGEPS
ncbi:MAG: hypothetical protein ACREVE_03935 [Gammaproteobacteria bacterium]